MGLSIRKDKFTKIARVLRHECLVSEKSGPLTPKKDTIVRMSAPEIFDRVLVQLSTRASQKIKITAVVENILK